jgi:hypothetical protein
MLVFREPESQLAGTAADPHLTTRTQRPEQNFLGDSVTDFGLNQT